MSNLRVNVRRDPLGRVAINVPGPDATLTTVPPSGAHLVVQLDDERALQLAEGLAGLLKGDDDK